MKKTISGLLCLLLLVVSISGCLNKPSGEADTQSAGNSSEFTNEETSVIGAKPLIISAFEEYENGQPKIVWKNIKGRDGFYVEITIKDSMGKIIEDQSKITESSYTIKAKLTEGETYSVGLSYVTSSGKKSEFSVGSKIEYTYCAPKSDFYFNYAMPVSTLNNYLSRAMTYCIYAESDTWYGKFDSSMAKDAKRAILNVGAKHIARAISVWVPSATEEAEYPEIKNWLSDVHSADSEIIFEACIFETCTEKMNTITIPDWVFKAFGQKVEKRNFDVSKMVFLDGYGTNQWGSGIHVPDITRLETQMWFYYRACRYIEMGCESLHLGQINLMGRDDKNNESWTKVIDMIRDYAKKNARRHYVLINGHYPSQNLTSAADGKMLVDFNAFPLRLKVADGEKNHAATEQNPQRCAINFASDAPYQKNIKGVSPSGCFIDKYPYLVEFDNDGGDNNDHTVATGKWGYDEISWFANQPQWYRHKFLKDIVSQVDGLKNNGHVALPGRRTAYILKKGYRAYYVMNDSKYYTGGFSDEEGIKSVYKLVN